MTSRVELGQQAIEERHQLVGRLTELVRTATGEELAYISEAPTAGPIQTGKHLVSLKTVIFKRDGRMTEKHDFFPGEAIAMVAEDADEHIGRAFEIATALVMLNALLNDDEHGAMSLLWAENGPVYAEVDRDFVEPFLLGFRWLAENATEWSWPHDPGAVEPVPSRAEIAGIVAGARATGGIRRQEAPEGPG